MRRACVLGAVIVTGLALIGSAQAINGHWRIDLELDPLSASFVDAFGYSTELLVKAYCSPIPMHNKAALLAEHRSFWGSIRSAPAC